MNRQTCPIFPSGKPAAGFTLLELVVTLVLIVLAILVLAPNMGPFFARVKLDRATRETASLLARARMEAIKTGNLVVVRADAANRTLDGFADVNRDGIFNPTPGVSRNTTDYTLARIPLPHRIELGAPGAQTALDGLTVQGSERLAIFQPDGSITDPGAIRLADDRGQYREIRIEPQVTPRTRIRIWDGSAWVLKTNPSGAIPR